MKLFGYAACLFLMGGLSAQTPEPEMICRSDSAPVASPYREAPGGTQRCAEPHQLVVDPGGKSTAVLDATTVEGFAPATSAMWEPHWRPVRFQVPASWITLRCESV